MDVVYVGDVFFPNAHFGLREDRVTKIWRLWTLGCNGFEHVSFSKTADSKYSEEDFPSSLFFPFSNVGDRHCFKSENQKSLQLEPQQHLTNSWKMEL